MEKGATRTDKAAHRFFDARRGGVPKGCVCAQCGATLLVAYHEERLYSVSCNRCEVVTLTKARSPYVAAKKVGYALRMEGQA